MLILVIIVIIAILWRFRDKGKIGENKVSQALCAKLDKEDRVLNDVIIPDNVGGTTQIDHIVLSPFGIFCYRDQKYDRVDFWPYGFKNVGAANLQGKISVL